MWGLVSCWAINVITRCHYEVSCWAINANRPWYGSQAQSNGSFMSVRPISSSWWQQWYMPHTERRTDCLRSDWYSSVIYFETALLLHVQLSPVWDLQNLLCCLVMHILFSKQPRAMLVCGSNTAGIQIVSAFIHLGNKTRNTCVQSSKGPAVFRTPMGSCCTPGSCSQPYCGGLVAETKLMDLPTRMP